MIAPLFRSPTGRRGERLFPPLPPGEGWGEGGGRVGTLTAIGNRKESWKAPKMPC
jgi:hypothetical protein